MSDNLSEIVKYVLKNKALVQGHMVKHQSSWGTSLPLVPDEEQLVNVYIRVRPLLPVDISYGAYSLVVPQPDRTVHFTHPTIRSAGSRFATKTFQCDGVFGDDSTNDAVYDGMNLAGSVRQCLEQGGQDLTVLAYGQTGTGKTFSTTAIEERTIAHIFQVVSSFSIIPKITLEAFEIRGGAAFDLLSSPPLAPVKILVPGAGDVAYAGLTMHEAQSLADLSHLISKAKDLRMTRSTTKNSASSRSHSVIRITVHFLSRDDVQETSHISILDLAGSERSHHMVQNDTARIKEAIETNKSLAALKDCIRARLNGDSSHAPWRGSKLTTVLKGVLARPSKLEQAARRNKLVVLACISPSPLDAEDTLNTLRYVAVFELSSQDYSASPQFHGRNGTTLAEDASQWSHEESVAYINRTYPKLAPFSHRLLATNESNMKDLFNLSLDELSALLSRPTLLEIATPDLKQPDARTIAQAKSWLPGYHQKLNTLALQSEAARATRPDSHAHTEVHPRAALSALSGTNPNADNTGLVTRVNWEGRVRHE